MLGKKKVQHTTDDETEILMAIGAMDEPDRSIAKKLHAIITANAPKLTPKTWYGMPAYSDGKDIVCFFRGRQKFGERYMTFGFNDIAKLDDGAMWPTLFAITDLTETEEAKIAALVRKAVR